MILIISLLIVGLALSALYSGSETGFYRVTRIRLATEALTGDWVSRALLWLSNQPTLFIATTLIGNNAANYVTSLAVVMASQSLFPDGGTLPSVLGPILIAPVVFVFGELLPKNLFFGAPNRLLKRCAPPLLISTCLFAPISIILWAFSRLLQLLTDSSPQELSLTLARRELAELLTEGHEEGILRPAQQSLAQAMLSVAGQPIRNFAVQTGHVVRVTTTMSKSDVLRIAQRHSRTLLPVEDTRNGRRLVGFLRTVDLYLNDTPTLPAAQPMIELRDHQSCLSALRMLNQTEDSLGHVVDDQGKTVGFVTGRELRLGLIRAS